MFASPFQDPTADVSVKVASNPKYNPYPNGLPETVQQQVTNRWAETIPNLFQPLWCSHPGYVVGRK